MYGIQELVRQVEEEVEASVRVCRPKVLADLEKIFSFSDGSLGTHRSEPSALEDSNVVVRRSSSQEFGKRWSCLLVLTS